MHKGFVGFAKYSVFVLALVALACFAILNTGVVSAVHTSSAELQPEWSPAGQNVDYTVTICNDVNSQDKVDEIRVYRNLSYTNFVCADKVGWEKYFITAKQACQYVATDPAYYIDPDECDTFDFSATTPPSGCQWVWEFESRDLTFPNTGSIQYLHDTTSVDDLAPEVVKTVTGPQSGICPPGSGEECWVTTSTTIGIVVNEKGDCGISGLDYCEITYTVDGGSPIVEVYDDLNGQTSWKYSMNFDEDSLHLLRVECKDIAGNELVDEEAFRVDSTPPATTKTYGVPNFAYGDINNPLTPYPHWITTHTAITLDATDPEAEDTPDDVDCSIGVEKTWYYDVVVPEELEYLCENKEACEGYTACPSPYDCRCGGVDCVENVQKLCKDLGAACKDAWEEMKFASETDCLEKITWADCVEILVNSRCVDCQCGSNWQLYREQPIFKPEQSCHILQFFSVDELGNRESVHRQCVYVEDTPPVGIKTVGDPRIPINEEFQTIGDGTAEWTDLEKYLGDYSAKLYVPDGTKDIAAVEFEVDVAVKDITELSFWQKISNAYGVNVILGVDADGDGIYESQDKPWHFSHDPDDLGDDSFIEMDGMSPSSGNWEEVDTLTISQWWTPDNAGNGFCPEFGWNYLSEVQSSSKCRIDPTDHVKVIRLLIGGSSTWMDKVAYVDDIELNGKTIKLEPKNWWVRDDTTALPGTPITLDCIDQYPHPVDHETVCYKVSFDGNPADLTEQYCNEFEQGGVMEDGWCCADVSDPKPPIENGVDFQTDSIIPQKKYILNFTEDSKHKLEYQCFDALGNPSIVDVEYFRVDSQPPIIEKTMTGPQVGDCPPKQGENCWIKDSKIEGATGTIIHVEANDDSQYGCAVDQVVCDWWYLLDGGTTPMQGQTGVTPPFDIKFYDETQHELHIKCWDVLGNTVEDVETFYVDSSGPTVTQEFLGPYYSDGYKEWIDTATTVKLTATDHPDAPCGVDQQKIYYKNTLAGSDQPCLDQAYCNQISQPNPTGDGWTEYTAPFPKREESCHILEYYAVDALGNIGPVGVNCFFVDKTPPIVSALEPVGQHIPCVDGQGCDYWVQDGTTQIKLSCYDPDPHPAGVKKIEYRWKLDGQWPQMSNPNGDWLLYTDPIVFNEDSVHSLEYRCTDNVDKIREGPGKTYRVDSTPPTISKKIVGPYFGQCPPRPDSQDICYIDNVTTIEVTATDPDPTEKGCAVDQVMCEWSYTLDALDKIYGPFTTFPIQFPEETQHNLVITCKDALGNTAHDYETFYVDHTPPVTTKTYSMPHYPVKMSEEQYPHWITSNTNITLTVVDAGPHKSGVKELNYRWFQVPDDVCKSYSACQEYNTETITKLYDKASPKLMEDVYESVVFRIPQPSCHMIEYFSVDNVDKTEYVKRQCVFVENTAPEPDKKVGVPNATWTPGKNGDPVSYYYPEANELCWNGQENQIECWQVTLLTPINLECVDPQPHPVDHETVCFKVSWDGDNVTQEYCKEDLTPEGFCCVDKQVPFYFGKTSEHELEYYCIDALGNKGQKIDVEKFKVEDTAFNITINKKWNLISTPVFLLDDSMDKVFMDVPGCVKSVWTYDAVADEWHIYTPDGNAANDDLKTMVPGDGYWALANHECVLQIGGSLMRPGPVGQASKEIVPGWNLIGYYGTDGLLAYDGPDGDGQQAQCALYSLGPSLLDKQFTGLKTYWEPLNPKQWYTHHSETPGLNRYDNMDPGAGYWLTTPQEGLYTPSTDCGYY